MFPARMSPHRNAPGRSARIRDARDRAPAAGADRGTAGGSLVVRVLLVTATAALSTLAVWLVGSGASASASEISADAEEILASPAGAIDGAEHIDGAEDEAPGPIAAAVNGLDEAAADAGATSGKAAPARSAPTVETASIGPETPPDRGSGRTEQAPTEQAPDELVGRPVEHVLHQARPALEPVARTGGVVGDAVGSAVVESGAVGSGAVGGGAASDDPVSAALTEIRGGDVADFFSPLWTEEGADLAPPGANPPASGQKAASWAEPARVGTASTPPHGALHGQPGRDQPRPDQRSAKVVPTGEIPENSSDARATPVDPEAPVIDALGAHPKAEHNTAGAVTDGGSQAGFAVGWYPVATPLDGSSPSKRIPDEDRVRSGTSAPQPGTTPD